MSTMRIFVSHSHDDAAVCRDLVTALRQAGADVWYDEHNLGSGQLMEVVQRELASRPVFLVILTKAAFASKWVRRETTWAYELADRDPTRIILPITASAIDRADFSGHTGWLFLGDFKRVEAPHYQPYPHYELIARTLHALAFTPPGEAPAPVAPQPAESADDLIERGKALSAQGNHLDAYTLFMRATQLAPQSFLAWFQLGYTLQGLKRYQEALTAYETAQRLNASESALWHNKGNVLWNLKRSPEALAAYEQALKLDPQLAFAWNGKGNALYNIKRYPEALAAYEQALTLDPQLAFAWNGKGSVLRELKRPQEALDAYEQALTLDPQYAFAWNGKGNALWDLTRNQEALDAYEQALTVDPQFARAWRNKAKLLRALGREPEARAAEAQAHALGG